jgi:hypothetical protein
LRSLTFARPTSLVPLQAADMLAHALYRDWLRTEYPRSRDDLLTIDEPLRRIQNAHSMLYGGLHNDQSLRNITPR